MNIEIHQPELEALILQRMASGRFQNIEDVLIEALKAEPSPASASAPQRSKRTGLDLLEVMQAMPYKDEIDIEPSRPHMPVRDVLL
jgi:hypothetical protein